LARCEIQDLAGKEDSAMPKPLLVFGCALLTASSASAGLYQFTDAVPGPVAAKGAINPLPFPIFRDRMVDIRLEQPTSALRKKYQERRTELERKLRSGSITVDDQIDLSAYLIRLGQYDAAIDVLTPLAARDRGNYLTLANLITAHQLNGQLDRAFAYLIQVKGGRPRELPGVSKEQLDWYARADSFHWKLVDLRYRESLKRAPSSSRELITLDDLLGVRFVGASGQYEGGQLAAEQREKLPRDAVAIVQQLLLWLPNDSRLYWLFGELLNAAGDLEHAKTVFDECRDVRRRFDPEELRAHRQIIDEALSARVTSPSNAGSGWLPDRNQLIAGGSIAGLIIMVLVYLQFREFRRRRQGVSPSFRKAER
jgi:hypothetical protein